MGLKWDRVDRRGQKPGREASSDEQLPLEVEDKFAVRACELLAPQWPEAPFLSARTDPAPRAHQFTTDPPAPQTTCLRPYTHYYTVLVVESMCV